MFMFMVRKVAREVLPLVVLIWATLVVLGGAYKAVEGSGTATVEQDPAIAAGLGLCTIIVAALLRAGAGRPQSAARPESRTVATPRVLRAVRPVAYARPLSTAPSLELLQILRT